MNIPTTYSRSAFRAAELTARSWATDVAMSVYAATLLADLLEAAHTEAIEIDAERPSADDSYDDLCDELSYSTDSARNTLIIRAELARRDAEIDDDDLYCALCGGVFECECTPKVSLLKAYVPTVPVTVGRCDRPVYSPANRTPRHRFTIDQVRVWSVIEHHNLIALHRILQHAH